MKKIFQLPWSKVEAWIDRTGMYRTVTSALGFLALCSVILGGIGIIPYTASEQLVALGTIFIVALGVNFIASKSLRIPVHYESAFITGLIVFFIVLPPLLFDWRELGILALVTALSVLSKFLFVWRKQHIFNPAALGSVLAIIVCSAFPVIGSYYPSWWIGTPALVVPLLIVGAIVVTKIRKWPMVATFIAVGFVVYTFETLRGGGELGTALPQYWLSGPSLFLAFFMLTEPFTTPPTERLQIMYAALVATLAQVSVFSPLFGMTPEIALVLGNVLFFGTTLRQKLFLPLVSLRLLAERTYEFTFSKPTGMRFLPGQYLEWMLPQDNSDSRGLRRYFTIAASPTEDVLRLAVRVPEKMSTYKQALINLKPGDTIIASQLAGDFTLPRQAASTVTENRKLGFIAGGIGITPFRSHLQSMNDSGVVHDTIFFYCNNTVAEIAYRDEFNQIATKVPLKVVHVLAKEKPAGPEFEEGFVTADMITRRAPDFLERTWYLSGPPGMVNAYGKLLQGMGVNNKNIIKDFFPGLA